MRFWKRRGVASSPEPRSVLRLGTWLRIFLSFFHSRRSLGSWTEAEFGKKEGGKVCIGAGIICKSQEEETPTERGWCKAAITVRRVRFFPLPAPGPARRGQHGVGAAGPERGLPEASRRCLPGSPRRAGRCPRAACRGLGLPGRRLPRAAVSPAPRARALGVGVAEARGSRLPALRWSRIRLRERKREKKTEFSLLPLQASAFLTCSSPGKASPGRGCPETGVPTGPRHASRSPHEGSESPWVKKGPGAGWREPPPGSRAESPVRAGASPRLAPRRCGSEVQLSLFSVLLGRPGSRFSYFWKIGLTRHRKKVITRSRSFSIT